MKALLLATLAVFGLIAWSSYPRYRQQRPLVERLESGDISAVNQLEFGFACDDQSCQIVGRNGSPIGPRFPIVPQPAYEPPAPGSTAEPSLPPVKRFGAPVSEEDLIRAIPELIPEFRAELARAEERLSPRASLQSRARAAGVFWGVLFAVLATSTLIGAEWRWGVWRTLLTHEPRRGRMVLVKLATVWTVIAIGLALTLAFTAGLDAIFRSISHVGASGGPSVLGIARTAGKALLSLEVYSTFAAAAAMTIRASFGGIAALALLLGDGLATAKWHWLRHWLPTQQIAHLVPAPVDNFFGGGYVWWTPLTGGNVTCTSSPGGIIVDCKETPLSVIPSWRAIVVLLAWIAGASLLAWVGLRSRDVPQ